MSTSRQDIVFNATKHFRKFEKGKRFLKWKLDCVEYIKKEGPKSSRHTLVNKARVIFSRDIEKNCFVVDVSFSVGKNWVFAKVEYDDNMSELNAVIEGYDALSEFERNTRNFPLFSSYEREWKIIFQEKKDGLERPSLSFATDFGTVEFTAYIMSGKDYSCSLTPKVQTGLYRCVLRATSLSLTWKEDDSEAEVQEHAYSLL